MTGAVCRPEPRLAPGADRAQGPDRLVELLDCLGDLRVGTARERAELTDSVDTDDPRLRQAIAHLTELESALGKVSLEAASVHQLLQHLHLIRTETDEPLDPCPARPGRGLLLAVRHADEIETILLWKRGPLSRRTDSRGTGAARTPQPRSASVSHGCTH